LLNNAGNFKPLIYDRKRKTLKDKGRQKSLDNGFAFATIKH